jgi:hypothetical protein
MTKIVVPDMGKSQVMPAVTVRISMPHGAAVPAQAAPAQADPAPAQAAPAQTAPAQGE